MFFLQISELPLYSVVLLFFFMAFVCMYVCIYPVFEILDSGV